MERRRLTVAIVVAAVSVGNVLALVAAGVGYGAPVGVDGVALMAAFAAFGVVGAVILAKVPDNRLGWVFGAIGMIVPLGGFQDLARPLLENGVSRNVVALGQAGADISWTTFLFLMMVVVSTWFPDGRPLSAPWGRLVWIGGGGWAIAAFLALFSPTKEILWDAAANRWIELPNPIGIPGLPAYESSLLGGLSFLAIVMAGLGGLAGLVVRYRRAEPLGRLQIRWLAAAYTLVLVIQVTGIFEDAMEAAGPWTVAVIDLAFALAILGIPVSVAIAITRYRLYELGKLISRTFTYALVIGALALLFAVGAVWLPQRLLGTTNNVAVAAGTLVAFLLFSPMRLRVQRVVDRRFNRLPYDPDFVVGELRARLHHQIEMNQVGEALAAVAAEAMSPTTSSVWIRVRP